jgi:hypothetical protein
MGFAGLGFWPERPPARARPCSTVGGYMRKEHSCGGVVRVTLGTSPRQPSRAAQSHFIHRRLRVVPYGLPGYRRLRRAPPQHRGPPQGARHLGRLCRRKGIPRVRRGVGYVGAWRFARPSQSHRGYLPVGEASGQNLPVGPPLGALRRCLRGAIAPRSRLPTALWGIQEGKADVTRGETGERRTSSAATRAPVPADPVT